MRSNWLGIGAAAVASIAGAAAVLGFFASQQQDIAKQPTNSAPAAVESSGEHAAMATDSDIGDSTESNLLGTKPEEDEPVIPSGAAAVDEPESLSPPPPPVATTPEAEPESDVRMVPRIGRTAGVHGISSDGRFAYYKIFSLDGIEFVKNNPILISRNDGAGGLGLFHDAETNSLEDVAEKTVEHYVGGRRVCVSTHLVDDVIDEDGNRYVVYMTLPFDFVAVARRDANGTPRLLVVVADGAAIGDERNESEVAIDEWRFPVAQYPEP